MGGLACPRAVGSTDPHPAAPRTFASVLTVFPTPTVPTWSVEYLTQVLRRDSFAKLFESFSESFQPRGRQVCGPAFLGKLTPPPRRFWAHRPNAQNFVAIWHVLGPWGVAPEMTATTTIPTRGSTRKKRKKSLHRVVLLLRTAMFTPRPRSPFRRIAASSKRPSRQSSRLSHARGRSIPRARRGTHRPRPSHGEGGGGVRRSS